MPDSLRRPLAECAREFAELRGEIARVRNGHVEQATVLVRLTNLIEKAESRSQLNHDETIRAVTGYQGTVTSMCATQSERTAIVEESSRSAHHRIDGQHRMLWTIIALAIASGIGIVVKLLFGVI